MIVVRHYAQDGGGKAVNLFEELPHGLPNGLGSTVYKSLFLVGQLLPSQTPPASASAAEVWPARLWFRSLPVQAQSYVIAM